MKRGENIRKEDKQQNTQQERIPSTNGDLKT
jgi:hypothetical protein